MMTCWIFLSFLVLVVILPHVQTRECRDHASWCDQLGIGKISLSRCYNSKHQRKCCASCQRLRLPIPNCPFGDKENWCDDISKNRPVADCYAHNTTCCQTCLIYDTGIPTCAYGDKASWCSRIGVQYSVSSCYDHDIHCCGTCQSQRLDIPGCAYGDKQVWCSSIGDLFPRSHCETDKDICCHTCHMLELADKIILPGMNTTLLRTTTTTPVTTTTTITSPPSTTTTSAWFGFGNQRTTPSNPERSTPSSTSSSTSRSSSSSSSSMRSTTSSWSEWKLPYPTSSTTTPLQQKSITSSGESSANANTKTTTTSQTVLTAHEEDVMSIDNTEDVVGAVTPVNPPPLRIFINDTGPYEAQINPDQSVSPQRTQNNTGGSRDKKEKSWLPNQENTVEASQGSKDPLSNRPSSGNTLILHFSRSIVILSLLLSRTLIDSISRR